MPHAPVSEPKDRGVPVSGRPPSRIRLPVALSQRDNSHDQPQSAYPCTTVHCQGARRTTGRPGPMQRQCVAAAAATALATTSTAASGTVPRSAPHKE